jgi:hypothetical protein
VLSFRDKIQECKRIWLEAINFKVSYCYSYWKLSVINVSNNNRWPLMGFHHSFCEGMATITDVIYIMCWDIQWQSAWKMVLKVFCQLFPSVRNNSDFGSAEGLAGVNGDTVRLAIGRIVQRDHIAEHSFFYVILSRRITCNILHRCDMSHIILCHRRIYLEMFSCMQPRFYLCSLQRT